MQGFDFDGLEPASVPVKYQGQSYVLREASEASFVAYQNAIARAVKLGPDKSPVSFDGVANARTGLVAACLFHLGPDGAESQMTPAELTAWPSKLVRQLYEWVEEVSEINTKDTPESLREDIAKLQAKLAKLEGEDPAKNGRSATTATSAAPPS